jgi:peroxiredoxin Q/BCP
MTKTMLVALLALVQAQQPPVDLKVGDPLPKFESPDDGGKVWKSADHVGKKYLVIYFYPAAFTGGCTAQARAFQADQKKFEDLDVEVIGVSGDTPKTLQAFRSVYKLEFTLLADEKGAAAKLFGVPVRAGGTARQTIDGKQEEFTRGVTLDRWTFVVDKAGTIIYKNMRVNPGQDSRAVLEALQKPK